MDMAAQTLVYRDATEMSCKCNGSSFRHRSLVSRPGSGNETIQNLFVPGKQCLKLQAVRNLHN